MKTDKSKYIKLLENHAMLRSSIAMSIFDIESAMHTIARAIVKWQYDHSEPMPSDKIKELIKRELSVIKARLEVIE